MSNSNLSFIFDLLCYLNRDQLERFSIVCRPLENLIKQHFHSKPYRTLLNLRIRGGSYALRHSATYWHPNQDDYSVQQFLKGQKFNINVDTYYTFADMRPYLGPTVRIQKTFIYVSGGCIYNPERVAEMESISHLWRDHDIVLQNDEYGDRIGADDFQLILKSPTILQCRELLMNNAHFSFKYYKILYTVKVIEARYHHDDAIDLWQQFLEQPGIKPIVAFKFFYPRNHELIRTLLERFSKAFSFAVSPNAFKIVFINYKKSLTEFREMNKTSNEILELKKGIPVEYQNEYFKADDNYTLERSSI